MKRFAALILAIGMCLSFMTMAPSNATQPEAAKKACTAKWFETGKTFSFDSSGGQPRAGKRAGIQQVRMYGKVYYDDCGSFARVKQVTYNADPIGFTGCYGGIIQNFQFNGNVLGTWNVPQRTTPCTAGTGAYVYSMTNPAYPATISASAPANERCFAVDLQLSLSGTTDKSGTSPSACVI